MTNGERPFLLGFGCIPLSRLDAIQSSFAFFQDTDTVSQKIVRTREVNLVTKTNINWMFMSFSFEITYSKINTFGDFGKLVPEFLQTSHKKFV